MMNPSACAEPARKTQSLPAPIFSFSVRERNLFLGWLLRWQVLAGAVVVLGLLARIRQYWGCPSYWYDEAYLILNLRERTLSQLLGAIDYQVVIPPFALWLLRGTYLLLGSSEFALRLPSLVAGMAAVLVAVPLTRQLVKGPVSAWALACCALSAHAIMHACEVRSYSGDVLACELVLWCSLVFMKEEHLWSGFTGLLLSALFFPWFSFPSVFVLGGAVLALFVNAIRRPALLSWLTPFLMSALLVISCLALYHYSARYLYYPGLREHWRLGFPHANGVTEAVTWIVFRLASIGDYAIRGMGVPLALLAIFGVIALAKRSLALAVLFSGPIFLGLVAAFLQRYPMDDRTLFYAVPCLWLPAAVAVEAVMRRVHGRAAVAFAFAFTLVLIPETVNFARDLVIVNPKADFRRAFQFVEGQRRPGDSIWVTHAEVYQTYYGKDIPVLGHFSTPNDVKTALASGRLWMVCSKGDVDRKLFPVIFRILETSGCPPQQKAHFVGLEVFLCEKDAQ